MESTTAAIRDRFRAERLEQLRPLLSEEVVTAWLTDPHAVHREPISLLARYLGARRASERTTVYEAAPGAWRLVHPPARRGQTYRIADSRTFDSLAIARETCLRRELFEVFGYGDAPTDVIDGPQVDTSDPVLLGYADRPSAKPGETITFMVSAEGGVTDYTTELIRLQHIDDEPAGPGMKVSTVAGEWTGTHTGHVQHTQVGSHVAVTDPGGASAGAAGFTLAAYVYPTCVTGERQVVIGRWDDGDTPRGYALGLDGAGRLTLWLADGTGERAISLDEPLRLHAWAGIAAGYDAATGQVVLASRPQVTRVNSRTSPIVVADRPALLEQDAAGAFTPATGDTLYFAALSADSGHYNGKIESPGVWPYPLDRAAILGVVGGDHAAPLRWDFAPEDGATNAASLVVPCAGHPEFAGRCVNLPVRGVTGRYFDGVTEHYRNDPRGYAAMHFHDDEMIDANWAPSHRFTVPAGLASGVYALRVAASDGSCEQAIPFAVRPAPGTATADVALLLPTATYLAYSNERGLGYVGLVPPGTAFLESRYDLAHSNYASHTDGSGENFTSWHRPIMTLAPGFRIHLSPFTLTSDLYVLDWLTELGYSVDVITDHDLHAEGAGLLGNYTAVLSGSHPEYASTQMLDGIEDYVDGGGNFAYIGGNGYYWIVSFHPELPHVMELRRGENGTRAWQMRAGEHHHQTTGERGGLWMLRSRPPQKIFGVGFSAQGGLPAGHYRHGPDVDNDVAKWLLDGVPETFGDVALEPGGAAGSEIDRYEPALGSPPGAVVVASSHAVGDTYQFAIEELHSTYPGHGGTEDANVRSDVVYFTTRGGGSVFSTGSISYSSGLSANGYDNGLSRITRNFLDHCLGRTS